jgi:hypothetical protein
MSESRTAEALKRKRDEIARSILSYEKKLAQARADLAHTIFAADGDGGLIKPYVDINGLFKRGEMVAIRKTALAPWTAEHPPACCACPSRERLGRWRPRFSESSLLPAHSRAADSG